MAKYIISEIRPRILMLVGQAIRLPWLALREAAAASCALLRAAESAAPPMPCDKPAIF
ncbi:MAG: hypothetical protein ACLQU1_08405 [Bryobacteraceae bacterium]